MNEIALLVPSRGRPASIDRLCRAINETRANVDLYVGLDPDDEANYPRWADVLYIVDERCQLGPWTNRLAAMTWDAYPILGSLGDDHVPLTPGWDRRIVEAFDAGSGIVYPNDGFQGENLPTAPFIRSTIVKALGYFFPPDQLHLYADDCWLEWGRRAQCIRYLPDVIVEHVHPAAGKADMDDGYHRMSELDAADHAAWDAYRLDGRLERDVRTILSVQVPA